MKKTTLTVAALLLTFPFQWGHAKGPGITSGKNMLQATSAGASALAEAYTARTNDITAMGYNPASLSTLYSGQASLMFHRGLIDDSYQWGAVGLPLRNGVVGASLGIYDGGNIDLFDGTNHRTVKAQSDLFATLGYARKISRFDVGISGKYYSSKLGDAVSANTTAMDLGMGMRVGSRIRLGVAVQNIGPKLTYEEESEKLPRIARAGLSYPFLFRNFPSQILFDVPYYVNEQEYRPSMGLETGVGPLIFRLGYNSKIELHQFTFGAGFNLGAATLDYSFGIVNELNSSHRVSLAYRFGVDYKEKVKIAQAEIEVIEKKIDLSEIPPINFLFDSAVISSESFKTLDLVADVAKKNNILNMRVEGHTDSMGSDKYNLSLSQRRANSVRTYLMEQGQLDGSKIMAVGFGETRPVDSNETEEGRLNNRRVAFIFSAPYDEVTRYQEKAQ